MRFGSYGNTWSGGWLGSRYTWNVRVVCSGYTLPTSLMSKSGGKMNQQTNRLAGLVKPKSAAVPANELQGVAGKQRVNFMIDTPLLEKIDKHAKQRGISRSAMISTMASELQ